MHKCSVIINNWNYAKFLREAVDSALAQTYGNVEVIAVDDGSTDNSINILRAYEDRITVIEKKNGGQASAFNAGYAASDGELVLFLDSDDFLAPNAIEESCRVFQSSRFGFFQFPMHVVDENSNQISEKLVPRIPMNGDPLDQLLRLGRYSHPPTSGNVFHRPVLDKLFPIDEADFPICADVALTTLAPFYGKRATHPTPLGFYRIHGNNNFGSTATAKKTRLQRSRDLEYSLRGLDLIYQEASKAGLTTGDLEGRDGGLVYTRIYLRKVGSRTDNSPGYLKNIKNSLTALFLDSTRSRFQRIQLFLRTIFLCLIPAWIFQRFCSDRISAS